MNAEIIWAAYCDSKSIHEAAAKVGLTHSSAHRALLAAGYRLRGSKFSAADDEVIRRYYADTPPESFSLPALTLALRRSHATNVSRRAKQMGLTDPGRPSSAEGRANIVAANEGRWSRSPHPRGAVGLVHTDQTKAAIGKKSRATWAAMTQAARDEKVMRGLKTRAVNGTLATNSEGSARTWKAAWREIGGVRKFYRSRWEANYARYLEWLRLRGQIQKWEHEPETFWFKGVKRGCVSYLPDFRVTAAGGAVEYHEVKGWMDARSKTKLKRMAKYHPKVKLIVIGAKEYKSLLPIVSKLIPDWE